MEIIGMILQVGVVLELLLIAPNRVVLCLVAKDGSMLPGLGGTEFHPAAILPEWRKIHHTKREAALRHLLTRVEFLVLPSIELTPSVIHTLFTVGGEDLQQIQWDAEVCGVGRGQDMAFLEKFFVLSEEQKEVLQGTVVAV